MYIYPDILGSLFQLPWDPFKNLGSDLSIYDVFIGYGFKY